MDGNGQELPTRDPQSLLHELDYWQAVLEEVRQACDVPPRIAGPLADIGVAVLEALLVADKWPALERIGSLAKQAMGELEAVGERVDAIAALANGRYLALRREAGLEP